ncbi:nuclear transport factor 2 family protein [Uliginosibacterium paludis]|uniref:Nuclear transport factor 2 family protein n=1 Tax=Uliginosibacterium paludis TaxID=1615952 RepID=A0ABV2CLM4_9RHOO
MAHQQGSKANADEISLRKLVRDFGAFADNGLFDQLGTLFAPEVRLDYSALGAPAVQLSREALIGNWASLLPGFDLTLHDIDISDLTLTADTARCEAALQADHFVGAHYWQLTGRYSFELRRTSVRWNIACWEITALTLSLDGELGSREVLAAATANVSRRRSAESAAR